jgi:CRP/FNR family transcriptional regulator, cyclic AMP receptor protein
VPDWVRSIPLFRDLDDNEAAAVAAIATRKLFKRGGQVVRQGDEADAAYVVMHGRLKVTVSAAEKDAALGIMGPGDVFGELGLLSPDTRGKRTATVVALEPTQVIVLGGERFHGLLRSSPGLAYKVLRHVAKRLVRLTEHVEATRTSDVRARLIQKLRELATSHGEKSDHGTRISLKLSQSDIAEMVGVTRESVNKHLRALAPNVSHRAGVLTIKTLSELDTPRAQKKRSGRRPPSSSRSTPRSS